MDAFDPELRREKCDPVNKEYEEYIKEHGTGESNWLLKKKSHSKKMEKATINKALFLASGGKTAQQPAIDNGFNSGLMAGAATGAVVAAVAILAFRKVFKKQNNTDGDFHRI